MREVEGILVDPVLPPDFDDTPNDERDTEQLDQWWGRPFIVTDTFEPESYDHYVARIRGYGWEPDWDRETWEANQVKMQKQWDEHYPSGTRYDVRCLDGGAWDRSTWWGSFATLEEAVSCAKSGPSWR